MVPDETDLLLIRILQDSPRASYAELARSIGIGETTAKRRLENLIRSGLITPAMIPDIYQLGYTTSAFVGLSVDLGQIEAIAEQLRDRPEVTMVAETTGRYDLMIFVAAQSLEKLTKYVRSCIARIEGVQNTETFIAPRVYKLLRDWRLPPDEFDSNSR